MKDTLKYSDCCYMIYHNYRCSKIQSSVSSWKSRKYLLRFVDHHRLLIVNAITVKLQRTNNMEFFLYWIGCTSSTNISWVLNHIFYQYVRICVLFFKIKFHPYCIQRFVLITRQGTIRMHGCVIMRWSICQSNPRHYEVIYLPVYPWLKSPLSTPVKSPLTRTKHS